jgi:D-threo-aldose 1-dehydrogenase
MNQAEMLAQFARRADFDCFLLAGRYTLLDQVGLKELLPLCEQRGIAIIAAGVFNSGILADPSGRPKFNYSDAPAELVERTRRIRSVCERHGVPLRAAAVQFPLGHPAVRTVLVGCRSAAEVEDAVRMFETEVPPELWDDLKSERLLEAEAPTP